MKDLDKMSERELRNEVKKLREKDIVIYQNGFKDGWKKCGEAILEEVKK